MTFKQLKFEIFGKVQGVYFRKYTKQKADSLKLKGFVKNTQQNTVIGELQGNEEYINNMKLWLQTEGSPNSIITNAEFSDLIELKNLSYKKFDIIR